jgi:hypothetical protein
MIISIVVSLDPALLALVAPVAKAMAARDGKLDQILAVVQTLQAKETQIMIDLTALTAQVAQNTSVEASAVTLIQGIAAELAAAQTDPAAVAALAAQLNTSATALAAAITANTPAAPPAPAPASPTASATKS